MEDERYTRITLRIPRELHTRLQGEADKRSRSQNAEIIERLEGSFSPALDIGRHLQSLVARYEQELAEAEVDKHILYLMLVEVAFNQKVFANTLRVYESTIPEALELITQWEADTATLLNEASAKLSMPLEEAKQKFEEASARLMANFKQRRETASARLPGAPTERSGTGD